MIAKEQRKIIDKKLKVTYDEPSESPREVKDFYVEIMKESKHQSNDESDLSGNISDSELDEMKLERDKKSKLQNNVDDRRRRLATSLEKKSNKDSMSIKRGNRKELHTTVKHLQ